MKSIDLIVKMRNIRIFFKNANFLRVDCFRIILMVYLKSVLTCVTIACIKPIFTSSFKLLIQKDEDFQFYYVLIVRLIIKTENRIFKNRINVRRSI